MRRLTTVRLECNRCRTQRQSRLGQSIEQLRKELAGVGWRAIAAQDVDVCSRCVAAAEQGASA